MFTEQNLVIGKYSTTFTIAIYYYYSASELTLILPYHRA